MRYGAWLLLLMIVFQACNDIEQPQEDIMMGKDIHSFSEPGKAVAKHLSLQLQVDFDTKQLSGIATWDIDTAPDAEEIIFDTKGLIIDSVFLNDDTTAVPFSLGKEDPVLGQALRVPLKAGAKRVRIVYRTSPGAAALQWLEAHQTAGGRHPFLFSQSQCILARSWVPCQDSPGIRFTYDAEVKVPQGMLALMSAENPQQKSADGVYRFRMRQPIPSYLLAIAAGDLVFKPISARAGVYAEPETIEAAVHEFEDLEEMIQAAEQLYGDYVWERYDLLVLPPSFPFGGMENPRLTFATPTIIAGDKSLTSLVAHELAHSWSGNLVTNRTWNDFWLNEGFTVYFERRIMEAMYGRDYAEMLAELGYQDLRQTIARMGENNKDTRLKLDLQRRDPDEAVTDIAYEKGYFFLRLVEETIGRDKFDAFVKTYFQRFAFRSMDTESFVEYFQKEVLDKNPGAAKAIRMQEWIYGTGLPDNCPKVNAVRFRRVEQALQDWLNGTPADSLPTASWSSHEWLHFVRHLPAGLSVEQMKALDEAFGFTQSNNAEIQAEWYAQAALHGYSDAYPAMEAFLLKVGRRKFLVPIYRALLQTEEGKALAYDIYAKARKNYHYVSVSTLDEMLQWNEKVHKTP
ncbi:M1 family metallopeptidase [Thermonema rossianum]|uniref:M1 family metallopeptidase n=1 Tax=Thermonema rossianum TaxID=55505 RepID=UPI00056E3824|nr:M1 family metallopeptidase [Thermonema rossianum]